MSLFKIAKEYIHDKPKIKKALGIILILMGLAALLTPLTRSLPYIVGQIQFH